MAESSSSSSLSHHQHQQHHHYHHHPQQQHPSPPPFSVEVIATTAKDGSIRTRSIADLDASFCLVDSCCDEMEPALVPICSSSDESSLEEEDEDEDDDEIVSLERRGVSVGVGGVGGERSGTGTGTCGTGTAGTRGGGVGGGAQDNDDEVSQTTTTNTNRSKSPSLVVASSTTTKDMLSLKSEEVGIFDCLSDQLASLFCPADEKSMCLYRPARDKSNMHGNATNNETYALVTNCPGAADVSCTDYPFQDLFKPGDNGSDVFSSLQFWWSPSQEEGIISGSNNKYKPQNRSLISRRRRAAHIEDIWMGWNHERYVPVQRSKSISLDEPIGTGTSSSTTTARAGSSSRRMESYRGGRALMDICYDSDPEQEFHHKRSRATSLVKTTTTTPKSSTTTMSSLSYCEQGPHYTMYRPEPIQTSFVSPLDNTFPAICPATPRNALVVKPFFDPTDYDHGRHGRSGTPTSVHSGFSTVTTTTITTSPRTPSSPVSTMSMDLMDPSLDNSLRQYIQEVTNTRLKLVWHHHFKNHSSSRKDSPHLHVDRATAMTSSSSTMIMTTTTTTTKTRAPMAVTSAFEVGAHLDHLVVQPKFTWTPTYEPHLDQRKLRLSQNDPDGIELLSIVRVVKPKQLDRRLYPFARMDRTLCITTNEERFPFLVFEAQTTEERDWLVTALKMLVARLASIIIVRDEAMLLEFFTPYSALLHLQQQCQQQHQQRPDRRGNGNGALQVEGDGSSSSRGSSSTSSSTGTDDENGDGTLDDIMTTTAAPTLEPNGELHLYSFDHGR